MIYLYVKTHNQTGLKYFGKTTKNPLTYKGSGKYWVNHLSKHGNDVSTQVIAEFDDPVQCTKFALSFSKENRIVESEDWANFREENGLDGAPPGHTGHKFTDDQIADMSLKLKKRWEDPVYKQKMSETHKQSWTDERRINQSNQRKGISRPDHSEKMKGRPLHPDHPWHNGGPKTIEHKKKISDSLKGKPKTEEHKSKLKAPKPLVVSRLCDRKPMAMAHFIKWCKNQESCRMRNSFDIALNDTTCPSITSRVLNTMPSRLAFGLILLSPSAIVRHSWIESGIFVDPR